MTEIVNALDAWMETNYGSFIHKFWGFCELSNRTHENRIQPIPVTITGTHKREQVSLDDKKELITWVRVVDNGSVGNDIEGNDWSFGISSAPVQTVTLQLIVAHKVELGENIAYNLARYLPDFLAANGFSIVTVDRQNISVDSDHESIYLTELGQGKYEQHRFPWNLYAIRIPVQFILNPNCTSEACCDDSILEEDNDCLILE